MALQAGNLLINRRHLTLAAGVTSITTGIKVSSNNLDPQLPARLMVLVMPPTSNWNAINAMSEPYMSGTDLIVDFSCTSATTINVLFFLPHSIIGPVSADDYAVACTPITSVGEACVVSSGGS